MHFQKPTRPYFSNKKVGTNCYRKASSSKLFYVRLHLSTTMQKSSLVRVKRKGQVTIPSEMRSKLGIEEGAILEIKEEEGTITLKPTPRLKAGKAIGEEEYKEIIRELDEGRRNWR